MIDYAKICDNLLNDFDRRSQEILRRRFGLGQEKRETLQSIGDDYHITRERVRQIENYALRKIEAKKNVLKPVSDFFYDQFEKRGGVSKEESILSELGGDDYKNHVFFLLTLGEPFYRFKENDRFYAFWTINKAIINLIEKIEKDILQQLSLAKRLVALNEIEMTSKLGEDISYDKLPYFIEISKSILRSPEGYYGLSEWPEVNPRGIKDKIYVVLKKRQIPLHFRQLAEEVNNFSLQLGQSKMVSPQSVHNELIRDERFILVGRGIYALRDSGYKSGPVRKLIAEVIKEAKKSLSKEEIVKEVKKVSLVKESTIISNLNNKEFFSKNKEGKFYLSNQTLLEE